MGTRSARCVGFQFPLAMFGCKPPEEQKLGALIPVIDAILEADKMAPPKQRHTAKRDI